MTQQETTAIAMLRSGASYQDAAEATGVTVARLMELVPMKGAKP